ncbi:ACT domain-containing protein [Paraburkholderia edwinii]|uniref:ACT domain-containing protein n=1 Tax=Paraburkholderia edwinii TaxID=2861782 RepID=A0ABX8UW98_9BURK|nr:ACT domain-containing protein [Paraburkholderia edwinii]QYD73259.1 ACT domain-containing protein [Paraburkholderia edwinii]
MRAQSTTKPLPGSRDLQHLLGSITPVLSPTRYTYCTVPLDEGDPVIESQAVATFLEVEGKTLVVEFEAAVTAGLEAVGEWAMLTMKVHSSLDAVGFIAAIASALAEQRISANVMSGFFHDHVFVQWSRRHDAIAVLEALIARYRSVPGR